MIDTSYSPQKREVEGVFNSISVLIGEENELATYKTTANSFRATLNLRTSNMVVQTSTLFNALTLLTDLNECNFGIFEKYINGLMQDKGMYKDSAIFVGDPIHPSFFDHLDSMGIKTVAFYPYQFNITPVDNTAEYYSQSPLLQPPLSTLIEIRRTINNCVAIGRPVRYIIFNPRGIYLTEDETQYYLENLKDLESFVLPDYFKGVTLSV